MTADELRAALIAASNDLDADLRVMLMGAPIDLMGLALHTNNGGHLP